MAATLGKKTATICAGVTANGTADCYAVVDRLKTKGYTGVPYGNSSAATSANFKDGKNRAVMYWTSHGYSVSAGVYNLHGGDGKFNCGPIVLSWTKNDPIEALFLASCYAFQNTNHRLGFAQALRNSNLFTVCGYQGQAPAGKENKDVQIVNSFFDSLDKGNGVAYAWKAGNQTYGKNSWGLVQYGSVSTNINYKLPGWGTNSGVDRSQPIWYLSQAKSEIINQAATASRMSSAKIDDVPLKIAISEDKSDFAYKAIGTAAVAEGEAADNIRYREWHLEKADLGELVKSATAAMGTIDDTNIVNRSIVDVSPISAVELGEDTESEPFTVSADIEFRQNVMGIPVEGNYVRICVDKNGVHHIDNTWHEIEFTKADARDVAIAQAGIKTLGANLYDEADIAEEGLVYAKTGDREYTLCKKLQMKDGTTHTINVVTGNEEMSRA